MLYNIETMGNKDKRIIKASFKDCPLSDRATFAGSSCIMPISVGQMVHEGSKFLAVINLINRSFKSCTLMIDDSVQRHTMKIDKDIDDKTAYDLAMAAGDDWLVRNQSSYQQLLIPYNIVRWDDWLHKPGFQNTYAQITSLYNQNENYNDAIKANIIDFLSRYQTHHPDKKWDYERAFSLCLDYLLEECAVMLLWAEHKYPFEVYPTGRNQAMGATHKFLIEPSDPDLLRSVPLRFKKYGKIENTVLIPQEISV